MVRGKVMSTVGYCRRYRTPKDFGMDPAFYGGSCEEYCWREYVARFHCPDASKP